MPTRSIIKSNFKGAPGRAVGPWKLKPMRRLVQTADLKYSNDFEQKRDLNPTLALEPLRPIDTLDLTQPAIKDLAQQLGGKPEDYRQAQRILILERLSPQSTLPERIAMDFLNENGVSYQTEVVANRGAGAGARVDILLDKGGYGLVWEIQGSRWHNLPGKFEKDTARNLALLGQEVGGLKVQSVTKLWENRLVSATRSIRENVLQNALLAIEVGQ